MPDPVEKARLIAGMAIQRRAMRSDEKALLALTNPQRRWLRRLKTAKHGRLRYGQAAGGMPTRTADALVRSGLAELQWQRVFLKHYSEAHAEYVILAENK